MASRFQAAALVAAPYYPNAVAWSDENLLAVASGHLVTILNPALPFGPRSLITIPECEPYPVGVVKREDMLRGCLLPTCVKWERRPCVRSISWSPVGMAANAGCLLAVCTTEGRVKLYRSPFCDFGAEWIEVVDISDKLYDYLASINFEEVDISAFELSNELTTEDAALEATPKPASRKEHKRRRIDESSEIKDGSGSCKDVKVGSSPSTKMARIASMSASKGKPAYKIPDNSASPWITADQYASRSAMLHSSVLAWSPVLRSTYPVSQNNLCNPFSILAVGGKSGKISFWKIHMPEHYSVEHSNIPTTVARIGLLQAHGSWITAISWALVSGTYNAQLLLVTGSSDGSVKIWVAYGEELLKSTEVHYAPFVLLKEVLSVNDTPVSVLSCILPVRSSQEMLLAVGKGSGSLEVWKCDIFSKKFDKAGSYDVHDQVITGLAWAFDGCYLYSCSQDNFVRGWTFHGSVLSEVPIPRNTPGVKSCTDLPDVFFSCLGVAVSPSNLVITMVRNLDRDALDHMYEVRALKAEVEFFWLGGQEPDSSSRTIPDCGLEALPDFPEKELAAWESNFLWSLKQQEDLDMPLVLWDVVAALLAFKRSVPKYVESTLVKWISNFYFGSEMDLSAKNVITHVSENVSKISSRRLQLLNSICRSVILSELKADQINRQFQDLERLSDSEGKEVTLWMELLFRSERELRERLVGFSFSSCISLSSHSGKTASQTKYWYPVGIAQMEQWVLLNHEHVRGQLKVLASEVVKLTNRSQSSKYVKEEQCSYCSAPVLFESPEVAFCQGSESVNGVSQKHELVRCAASMQVCPATPLWFCKCCHRLVSNLAPESLFSMPRYPEDIKSLTVSTSRVEFAKPWCPFCGILLQRLQPGFLLSASPV